MYEIYRVADTQSSVGFRRQVAVLWNLLGARSLRAMRFKEQRSPAAKPSIAAHGQRPKRNRNFQIFNALESLGQFGPHAVELERGGLLASSLCWSASELRF